MGISDIGFSVFAYTKSEFPVMATLDLPLGYESAEAATRLANTFYREFKPKELDNVKVLYLHGHGPSLLHTKGKPVNRLEDLRRLKVQGSGINAIVARALGATPVAIPMGETYATLQRGILNGCMMPPESNKGWKLGEVLDYVTAAYSAAYTTSFFVIMNRDKWHSLPEGVRIIIDGINQEWALKHAQEWDQADRVGIQYLESKGGQIINLDTEESRRWKNAVAPIISDHRAQLNKKGYDGDKIVDFVVKKLSSYQ